MTMPKAWHLRDSVNGLFMKREKKGIATITISECDDYTMQYNER